MAARQRTWLVTRGWKPHSLPPLSGLGDQDRLQQRQGEWPRHLAPLGQGGDFTVNSAYPNPWFSHQHDAHYIDDSTIILFDNGNTRRASDPKADSRGQVWKLDERTMTATLVLNVDLGNYSDRLGSGQVLSNGNYCFTLGAQGAPPYIGQSIEVQPNGTKVYVLQANRGLYRSFRVRTLYDGVSDQLASDGSGETSNPGDQPPAFRGLDVTLAQFHPTEPCRTVSPVFALNFGEASQETLPALYGLLQAEGQIPPNPISPVFFGLANGTSTTTPAPSQDTNDQIFASLRESTNEALWTF